ncbi:hypothetical protein [Mucilaginibacter sp.]|uniref:hypothetical protein n=1 Tax=Mucilaginibacter sp. TaxID=1882438 RepID=UPI0025DB37D5|nr:hypothetical protein [Mucilaginibacter sp.]
MEQLQLYINDQLADLSDDSPIALTFQINNLAEVKNQQGNTSNQFKLPFTQRNRQILGFPDDVAFTTNLPYDYYQARIIQDGLEIVPYGIAQLNTIEQNSASITVLSGNVDFFDAIDGKLYDMGDSTTPYGANKPFKKYQHKWNVESVAKSQIKNDGWIWPVVDYGSLVYKITGDNEINVRQLRPGFFIKTAIDIMLESNGYKATGSLLKNPIYPLLIAQFSNDNFDHGSDYQNQPATNGIIYYNGMDISVSRIKDSHLEPGGPIIFPNRQSDPNNHYIDGKYTARETITVDATLTIPTFHFHGSAGDNKSDVEISIILDTPGQARLTMAIKKFDFNDGYDQRDDGTKGRGLKASKTYTGTVITAPDIELADGQQLSIEYDFHGAAPYDFIIYAGATFAVTTQNQKVLYGQDIQCERIFPDISQKDLLKDVLQRFGIICQTDNTTRTINFASFKDIVGNMPVAKNWTSKCLDQGKTVSFQLGGYAQVNNMKYKTDDNVLPKGFADSQIKVADKTLPATADLFESQFAPTLNRPYIGGTIAQIKMIDDTSDSNDFSIGVTPRILIDYKLPLGGRTIKFTDGDAANDKFVNEYISVPYFYKPDGAYNLSFADMPGVGNGKTLPGLKTLYYPELEKILQQTKKVVRYFLLTPLDILKLDLLIPIYLEQDSCYYYINKIDSWRQGQPTKVELVKLG